MKDRKQTMVKKILILAGSYYQIPLIERAKERGLYFITCDYLPENSGHRLADEYHNVSTTDLDGVTALARDLRVGRDRLMCRVYGVFHRCLRDSSPFTPACLVTSMKQSLD